MHDDSTPHFDEPGVVPFTYLSLKQGAVESVDGGLIDETRLGIFVNGQELATLMCSPVDPEALALGFLYTEGVISSMDDVRLVCANMTGSVVDVFLGVKEFTMPRRMILTSGCGGGITFRMLSESFPPLPSALVVAPGVLHARMRDFNTSARLYRQVRGIHTAILGDADRLILGAEDIGRHNTIDRLAGQALRAGIDTRDLLLVSSGRISSEMLVKARLMQIPIVASRTAPTRIAVELAQMWQVCVVGYVRQGGMRVYTHPWRLGLGNEPVLS
ncbi:MAG: formate dehydrogenase accessory sulfurtransferase FdhD [Anaerolineae bacterium]|nr:formate dehydrogenase accessory sulfurtransferase FdhD [Anaerolineae bacterium]